jgi:hypothetical protein
MVFPTKDAKSNRAHKAAFTLTAPGASVNRSSSAEFSKCDKMTGGMNKDIVLANFKTPASVISFQCLHKRLNKSK